MISKSLAFELCTDNPAALSLAGKLGYQRIELCTAIQIGGLTPSAGLIKKFTAQNEIEIHILLRHRAGDFNYPVSDFPIFIEDIEMVKNCGGDGIVTGCLTADCEIDTEFCRAVARHCATHNLEFSFHRAFDFVRDPYYAIEQLIDFGYKRILTSGQAQTAEAGLHTISNLLAKADGRIQIMAGSGIGVHNAMQIAKTGVDALHFTAYRPKAVVELGMGDQLLLDEDKMTGIPALFRHDLQ